MQTQAPYRGQIRHGTYARISVLVPQPRVAAAFLRDRASSAPPRRRPVPQISCTKFITCDVDVGWTNLEDLGGFPFEKSRLKKRVWARDAELQRDGGHHGQVQSRDQLAKAVAYSFVRGYAAVSQPASPSIVHNRQGPVPIKPHISQASAQVPTRPCRARTTKNDRPARRPGSHERIRRVHNVQEAVPVCWYGRWVGVDPGSWLRLGTLAAITIPTSSRLRRTSPERSQGVCSPASERCRRRHREEARTGSPRL